MHPELQPLSVTTLRTEDIHGALWYTNSKTPFEIVLKNGTRIWKENDVYHRDGDKPAVIYADGSREWWRHGRLHREGDQPAKVCTDRQEWWYDGVLHRFGNPAIVYTDGSETWYQEGVFVPITHWHEAVTRFMDDRYHNMMPRIGPLRAVYAINGQLLPCVQHALATNTVCTLPLVMDILNGKHPELHNELVKAANHCVSNAYQAIVDDRISVRQSQITLTVADSGELLAWSVVNHDANTIRIFSLTHELNVPRTRVTLQRLSTECKYDVFPVSV